MRVRSSRFLLPALLWALPAVVSAQAAPPLSAADLGALRLRNIGPASMSGRVVDMDVVESNPSTWYVAGATGGLWRTEDNGVTWASTFDAPVHSIGDVAVFQPNPQILWVGTGERASRRQARAEVGDRLRSCGDHLRDAGSLDPDERARAPSVRLFEKQKSNAPRNNNRVNNKQQRYRGNNRSEPK